jgi:transposase-like protein
MRSHPHLAYPGYVPVAHLPEVSGLFRFDCPRCDRAVSERFYGPCEACRAQLGEKFYKVPMTGTGVRERPRFEPKMHVVPNNVAAAREVDELEGPESPELGMPG